MNPYEQPALSKLAPICLMYHENSKINRSSEHLLTESIAEFTSNIDELRRSTSAAKTYPGSARVQLSDVRSVPKVNQPLNVVLSRRRSVRAYAPKALSLPNLTALLEHADGVTGQLRDPVHAEIVQSVRAAPSGGALYPIEVYVVALNVDGLSAGVYHYHPVQRCLEVLRLGDFSEQIGSLVLTGQPQLTAAAVIVLTGRWNLPLRKYGERGYRVLLLDAGHVAQNILLVATALGIGACPVAGFHDDALARELGVDAQEEPVLYTLTLGHPPAG